LAGVSLPPPRHSLADLPALPITYCAATILVTENSRLALPLVRRLKALNRSYSVYWKRQFPDGRVNMKRSVRKKD